MGQYYGVVRSSEYLVHYGVKGMRWGIIRDRIKEFKLKRKDKKLERQYNSAKKKLNTLKSQMTIKNIASSTQQDYDALEKKIRNEEEILSSQFKNTKYEKDLRNNRYNGIVQLIAERETYKGDFKSKPVATISAKHLSADYNGKDKQDFLNKAKAIQAKHKKQWDYSATILQPGDKLRYEKPYGMVYDHRGAYIGTNKNGQSYIYGVSDNGYDKYEVPLTKKRRG